MPGCHFRYASFKSVRLIVISDALHSNKRAGFLVVNSDDCAIVANIKSKQATNFFSCPRTHHWPAGPSFVAFSLLHHLDFFSPFRYFLFLTLLTLLSLPCKSSSFLEPLHTAIYRSRVSSLGTSVRSSVGRSLRADFVKNDRNGGL